MDENDVRGRTYNYLRLAIVAVTGGLFASLALEWTTARCLQTSISAYYYTPVRAVLVGALVAIGVALVAIWGRSPVDDAFMNLAGLFAPVVAFVPTATANRCSVVSATGAEMDAGPLDLARQPAAAVAAGAQEAVDNNMWAYFLVVGASLAVMAWLRRGALGDLREAMSPSCPRFPYLLSFALAILFWVVGVGAYVGWRDGFYARAHDVSAIALFLSIIVVVFACAYLHARWGTPRNPRPDGYWDGLTDEQRKRAVLSDRYALLGYAMVGTVVLIGGYELLVGWRYWVLALEAALIALFLVFWVMQTADNWYADEPAPAAT
ncbi:hypothetical protein [Nocardioides sp. YIM 152588]|uniref:hypothetical protein n=1 Tax=Nocardioides sp. YIM 152588 TaxID=3158259 RepID=UPI0032E49739